MKKVMVRCGIYEIRNTVSEKTYIGAANSGRSPTEETRKKLSDAMVGRKFSEETIKKMGVAGKQRWVERKQKYWSEVT